MPQTTANGNNRTVFRAFPPAIYATLAGSAFAIVITCWIFFSEDLESAVPTAAITVFTVISLLLPFAIWRTSKEGSASRRTGKWLHGSVEVWQGRLKGRDAAILALLPPLSVAVGLALMSVVAQLAADHVI